MRSTQYLLTHRFEAGTDSNQHRLKSLERKRERSMSGPEHYHDHHTGELMHEPCNIKLKETAEDYYIDYHTLPRIPVHPLSRERNWVTSSHAPDRLLGERIATMLTIEEIKEYLLETEAKRQTEILGHLQNKSDEEVNALLAFKVSDIIKAYQYATNDIPSYFYSMLPPHQLMTVPVLLDNEHIIDFYELIAHHLHLQYNAEEQVALKKRFADHIEKCRYDIESERTQFMNLINHNISTESLSPSAAIEEQQNFDKTYQEKLMHLENLTLERYIELFEDNETTEYMNPITQKPLQSIRIHYQLLNEINDFLDPVKQQLLSLQQALRKNHYHDTEKSYAELLREKEYPAIKIPESLAVGLIPGGQHEMEIMTHPVILDGIYTIDYMRLKKYWDSSSSFFGFWRESRHGLNPFTGKPLTSIVYDQRLKSATNRFINNLDKYNQTITYKEVSDSNFLLRTQFNYAHLFAPNNWRHCGVAALIIPILQEQDNVSLNH